MTDTPTTASPVVPPSALDLAVAQDAAAMTVAPTELQILIGSLENLAAGVIPGLAAAGTAVEAPTLTPEALAAAQLLSTWLKSLPAAQAAAGDATAAAATTIAQAAVAPAIAKLPMVLALLLLGAAGAMAEDAPVRIVIPPPSLVDHMLTILTAAMPWILCVLGALVALGKVIQPELAKRSPAIGNAVELIDHVADFLYSLLTSKAGKAEDALAEQHTAALTGLLSQLNGAASNPIVEAAIGAAVAKLPAPSQDAIKAIQSTLPVYLKAMVGNTAPAPAPNPAPTNPTA